MSVSGAVVQSVEAPLPSTLSKELREQLQDLESGTFIIRFTDAVTDDDIQWLLQQGVAPGIATFTVIPAVGGHASIESILEIAKDPRVAHVTLNEEMEYHLDRAVQAVRADQAWDADFDLGGTSQSGGFDGDGVVVAVVDSGVDGTHPDLLHHSVAAQLNEDAKVIRNYKILSTPIVWDPNPIEPTYEGNRLAVDTVYTEATGGHGTHVSGTVAGTGAASDGRFKGAAPGADLVVYGAGEGLSILEALASFEHIHLHHEELGIRIVSNSWGTDADYDPENPVVQALETLAVEDDLVVIFSAGNAAGDGSEDMTDRYGKSPHAIMVANYYDKDGWLDWSSSRGLRDDPSTWPNVAAPGTQIISAAAQAAPITYVGTALDVLHTIEDGKTEPWVVPAPVDPMFVDVAGEQEVMLGRYASFTGTSMAAPMVAGTAAMMIEANPALSAKEVMAILEGTANMPEGRSHEKDGYAIGHGVIDATQAVAASLRMADGASLHEAVHQAYADTDATPTHINNDIQENLRVEAPATENTDTLTVDAILDQGPLNNDSIPLAPTAVAMPDVEGSTHVYQGGFIDPFLAGGHTVLPGEPVGLSVRGMTTSADGLDLSDFDDLDAKFFISQGGVTQYGPIAATVADDTEALGGQSMSADWTVPLDADAGGYVLEPRITVISSGQTYTAPDLEFMIAGPPDTQQMSTGQATPAVDTPTWAKDMWTRLLGDSTQSSTLLEESWDEGYSEGWYFRQDAANEQGHLTNWAYVTSGLSWNGANTGNGFVYVGLQSTSNAPVQVSQFLYGDNADTTLVSPEIDLTNAVSADLEYALSGASEQGFDFLTVNAVPTDGSGAVELARYSGPQWLPLLTAGPAWQTLQADLSPVLGKEVRLEFTFTSDIITEGANTGGWSVDDVKVTATTTEGGGGGDDDPVIVPAISASPDFGIGGLDTTLTYDAVSNVPINWYHVDAGDGASLVNLTDAGSLNHSYATAGQYVATVTAYHNATTSATASVLVDVVPVGVIQVRAGDGAWVDAGPDTGSDVTYTVDLDVSGLAPGNHTVETRLFDSGGLRLADAHLWQRV